MTRKETQLWVEECAIEYLRRIGFEIIERNPFSLISAVAWDSNCDAMVFIRVKHHKNISITRRHAPFTKAQRANVKKNIYSWIRANKWRGVRFTDVIDVYGIPDGGRPVIDHIKSVS